MIVGYETELLIGTDTQLSSADGGIFFMVTATIDMRGIGDSALYDLPYINRESDKRRWFWYAPTGDGNTQVDEDRYGNLPCPIPLKDAVEALRKDVERGEYHRFKLALTLCEAMLADQSSGEFSVLLWGY